MDVQHERRVGQDRREFAVYYRYGNERRNNTGNRRLDTVGELQPYFTKGLSQGYVEASDRAAEIVREIAEAFGVEPDSLTLIEHDDLVDSAEICHPCEAHARRNERLESELTEARKDSERYRNQVRNLLRAVNSRQQ